MKQSWNREYIFENMPMRRALYQMVFPSVFAQLVVLMYNLVDTFYIGRTNNPYMVAGVSVILPVYNVAVSIAGLTGIGGGALIARLLGMKEAEEAKKVSMFCIYSSIALAVFFAAMTGIFHNPLLRILGAEGETALYAGQYAACVIFIGGVPTVLAGTLSNLLRSIGYSGKAGIGVTLGSCMNIVLDPLFMFVLLPEGAQIIGVGIATALSNVIVCVYYGVSIRKIDRDSIICLSIKVGLPRKADILSVFSVGVPSALSSLLYDVGNIVTNHLLAGYTDYALAAIGIATKAERLPLNVGTGICQGTMPIIAYNYASGNRKRMAEAVRGSVIAGMVTAIASVLLYEVFSEQIIRVFINEVHTLYLGICFLKIRCIATPLMFLSLFIMTVFQGIGKASYAVTVGAMRWGVFYTGMVILLNQMIGMYGIVWAQTFSDMCTLTLSLYLCGRIWKKRRKAAAGKTDRPQP